MERLERFEHAVSDYCLSPHASCLFVLNTSSIDLELLNFEFLNRRFPPYCRP